MQTRMILVGMVMGLVVGLIINMVSLDLGDFGDFIVRLNQFIGDLFLRGLRFVAVPIVLFSLISGAGGLKDGNTLGRLGLKTLALYMGTTAVAITIGLLLANVVAPGEFVSLDLRDKLAAESMEKASMKIAGATQPDVWTTVLDIIPKNPFSALANGKMLQVVFFALAIGMGATYLSDERRKTLLDLSDGLTEVMIQVVHQLMRLAPLAVFCLLVKVTATLGLEVLSTLLVYSLVVIAGLLVMMLGVYPLLLRIFGNIGFLTFFKAILPAQLVAFSSSSSSATMPVTLECVEKGLGVKEEVSSFIVPLGATINMDGTALYQGVAALFIVQIYQIPITFADQLTIVLTATLASIGTAGVPGVGLIMLVVVLQSIGVPPDAMSGGLAIIFGVDRLLDMCRTTCNVTGDCAVAAIVGHSEVDDQEVPLVDEG